MSIRTSYSQNNTYITCPQHWKYSYIDKLKSEKEGASLYFGSAVDAAAMEMLKGAHNWLQVFNDRWFSVIQNKTVMQVYDNPNVVYSYNDFDEHLFSSADKQQLTTYLTELGLNDKVDPIEYHKDLVKRKKNPYKTISDEELKYFNRVSWLSLKLKGAILLNSFNTQFMPRVKKVIATQQFAKIEDPNSGDVINGYIDMVLEIDGYDKPIIFDLKTAGQPYTKEQIDLTEQLTLYAAMKAHEYQTDLVGYVVLCKSIPKDIVNNCSKCNHLQDGRHKTCNNDINGVRCNGSWVEAKVLRPEVQVLIEKKTPEQINDLLVGYGNIIDAMKMGIVYKNTSKCKSWFGGACPFYNLCHGDGNTKGLIKK
jgi:hypothetical protein